MFRLILALFVMLVLAGGSIALIKSITQRHQARKPDYDNIASLEKELLDPKMLEFDMSGKPLGDDPYQHYLYVKAQLANAERQLKMEQEKKERLLRAVEGMKVETDSFRPYVQTVERYDGSVDKYYTWTDPKTGATMGRREVVYDPLPRPARYYDPGYG